MEENILASNDLSLPHNEKVSMKLDPLTKMSCKPWKRSLSLDCPIGLHSDYIEMRTSKSLSDIDKDLCPGKLSPPRICLEDLAKIDPPKSPTLNNGYNNSDDQLNGENKISDLEEDQTVVVEESNSIDQIGSEKLTNTSEKAGIGKNHFSFEECGKDNKEEMGRCVDFIERDLMKLTIRVADKKYKVEECQIVLSPLTGDGECNQDMERVTVSISKEDIQSAESLVKVFFQEGLKSYKAKLMKELGMEREIEYVSLDSPPSSPTSSSANSSCESNVAGPSGNKTVLSPHKLNINTVLTLEDLPDNLVKEIQFVKKAPSPDSESTDMLIPTIPGMKTVPLNLPPSKSIAGYIFIPSSKLYPSLLFFFPHDLTLKEVLEATNRTANSLAQFLMSSDIVTQATPLKGVISTSPTPTPVNGVRKRGRPRKGLKQRAIAVTAQAPDEQPGSGQQDKNGFVCTCRNKPVAVPTEEKTVTLVDCDDCGMSFKEGRVHKCAKKKASKKELPLFPCELCERLFTHKAHLVNHMRSHKDYLRTTVLCRLCNKRFKKKGEIAMHKAQFHPESLEHFCDCGQQFKTLSALNQHKKSHKNDSTMLCAYCKGTFEITYYEKFHKLECSVNPINYDSRTDGTITVTTNKPIAKRSKSLFVEEASPQHYYEEEILEEFEVKVKNEIESDSDKGKRILRSPLNKKRYNDDFSSDSETELPPRKIYRAQDKASLSREENSHFIDEEMIVAFETADAEEGHNMVDVEEIEDYEC